MKYKKTIIGIVVTIVILSISVLIFLWQMLGLRDIGGKVFDDSKYFTETIPGSTNHSPDGTWWGYNMSKIARNGDYVFTFYIDNEKFPSEASKLTLMKKQGDAAWKKGAAFPARRPGNILLDSQGVLHAFTFEQVEFGEESSPGHIKHYWFPNAANGDITNYKEEFVVENPGEYDITNIRIGAAIGEDDTMAIAFGLPRGVPPNEGHSEHLYYKKPGDESWIHSLVGDNLNHNWFYPFVLVDGNEFHITPVQDDCIPEPYSDPNVYACIYQKIMHMKYDGENWNNEMIADHTNNPVSEKQYRTMEQSELYEDVEGNIHLIYKESLSKWGEGLTGYVHLVDRGNGWEEMPQNLKNVRANWIRLFEVDDELYYLVSSYLKTYVGKVETGDLYEIKLNDQITGAYPYIANPRSGTDNNEEFIDIIILAGYDGEYPNAVNSYVRIPKDTLRGL